MDSKPTIEQFIQDCFRARTAALKLQLEIHQLYWRRFYQNECRMDSRRGVVERSEREKIESVLPFDNVTGVVTTGYDIYRNRYNVKLFGESWLIQEVDSECSHCRVFGTSTECVECGGTGWQTWKDLVKRNKQRATRQERSSPSVEFEGRPFRDPDIENFMTYHFRERTEALKKEMEIHAEYAKRFYAPECDWNRWVVSVQWSEAEKIMNIADAEGEVQVITDNVHSQRSRYHLRPAGQSWLIWEVDMECPVCRHQGRTADCFWCGGTIWDRIKASGERPRGEPPSEEPPSQPPRFQP
jgi:hypothetical protein